MTDLSIIIASFNTKDLTVGAINSVIKNTKDISFEIIVIDNASKDGSAETLKKLAEGNKNITLVSNKTNVGFGSANNQGTKIAKGRYILFLNTDTLVLGNVLGEMIKWMDKNPKVGVSSCSLKYEDGTIQATGGYFPTLGKVFAWMMFIDDLPGVSSLIKSFHPMHDRSPLGANTDFYKREHEMDWVTAAFLILRTQTAKETGFFDKDYFMYMEEVDYCYRVKKLGWKVMYLPRWSIIHFGGASATKEFSLMSEVAGLKIFYKKHMPGWQTPILRLIIKMGALLRMPIFGKTYAKIFVSA